MTEAAGSRLRTNVSWSLVGNGVYAAAQLGMLLTLARAGSTTDVGLLALGLAVAAPVFVITDLNLRVSLASDAGREFSFSSYLGLRTVTVPSAVAVVVCIAVVVPFGNDAFSVILMACALKAVESMQDVHYGAMQRVERLDLVAKSQMVRAAIGLPVFATLFVVTSSVAWALVGPTVSSAITLLAFDRTHLRSLLGSAALTPVYLRSQMWRLVRTSAPLGVAAGVNALTINVPRYLIEWFLGTAALGIFAGLAYLVRATDLLAQSIYHGALPRLANYHASGEHDRFLLGLRKLIIPLVWGSLAGLVVTVSVGKRVAALVLGDEYGEAVVLLGLMMVAALGLLLGVVGAGLVAMRRFLAVMAVRITVFVMTLGTAPTLIRVFELEGAAFALAVGVMTGLLLAAALLRRALGTTAHGENQARSPV